MGRLQERKPPNYDLLAEKRLRADEDFCCKGWNFHLQGSGISLARGIYHKGEGNCCPSRRGVLVKLEPSQKGLTVAAVERISPSEYDRWNHCHCVWAAS